MRAPNLTHVANAVHVGAPKISAPTMAVPKFATPGAGVPGAKLAGLGDMHTMATGHAAARPRMRLRKLALVAKSAFPTSAGTAAFEPTDGPAGPAAAFGGPAVISGAGDSGE